MSDVLRAGYFAAGRANLFFSTYHKVPWMKDDSDNAILDIMQSSTANGSLFVSHYLFGAYDTQRANGLLVSQFRHPLARIVSIHSWLQKYHSGNYKEGFPSLERFAETSKGIAHSQISQFSVGFGAGWRERISKLSAEQMLEIALKNLEEGIGWFGLAEFFEESIFCLSSICGLPSIPIWKKDNRNAERTLVDDIPSDARASIEYHYAAEFSFYAKAKEIFLRRVGDTSFGPDFLAYKEACTEQYKEKLL